MGREEEARLSGVNDLQAFGAPPRLLQSSYSSLEPRPAFEADHQAVSFTTAPDWKGVVLTGSGPSWEELAARKGVSHEPRHS